jgi:hypothetical protein
MTVARLLTECSSLELEQWRHFITADAEHEAARRERQRFERDIGV